MNKPKVLWVYTTNPGTVFYRMYQFAQRMSEMDLIHSRMFPNWNPKHLMSPTWETTLGKDLEFWQGQVEWADIVIVQYISSPAGLSLVQAIRDRKPCVMEIDDCLDGVPAYSKAYDSNVPGDTPHYFSIRQMMESTAIVTSTQFLANFYEKYNKNIHVVPNCIDFRLWDYNYGSRNGNGKVNIGWIGAATHDGDLKLIHNPLMKILDNHDNVEVTMVSSPAPEWKKRERLNLIDKWVNIDSYPKHVMGLHYDIGLCPLRDNLFNRSKSNLRYLEYSACGIPTVASYVEPFKTNFNGLSVNTEQEWVSVLENFISNDAMRKSIGAISKSSVMDKFNVDVVSNHYLEVIRSIL